MMYGIQGNDGDITLSASTTLSRDMYYNNLTLNSGVTLNPGGFRIFVSGTLTMGSGSAIARNGTCSCRDTRFEHTVPASVGALSHPELPALDRSGDDGPLRHAGSWVLTDVPGVRGADGDLIRELSVDRAGALVTAGVARGGMIPKLNAAVRALDGASAVHIVGGRVPHALLTAQSCGTRVARKTVGGTVGDAAALNDAGDRLNRGRTAP